MIFLFSAGSMLFIDLQSELNSKIFPLSIDKIIEKQNLESLQQFNFILPKSFGQQIDCNMLNLYPGRHVVNFDLTAAAIDLPIMGHSTLTPKTFSALTFNEQIPGPTLRVIEGDVVMVTLTVPPTEPTSFGINLYSSETSSENLGRINPGTSTTQCFIARAPGIFSYHGMGVNNIGRDQHTLSGMYGMVIVDPLNAYKKL